MSSPNSKSSANRRRWLYGALSLAALLVFFGNILIGKYRITTGIGTAAPLDGVPEFLILGLSIALFVACMVYAERAGGGGKTTKNNKTEKRSHMSPE